MAIKVGDTSVREIETSHTFDPQTGIVAERIFEGEEEALLAFAQDAVAQGAVVRVSRYQGPIYRASVTWPNLPGDNSEEAAAVDQWERTTEWREIDIRYNPKIIANLGGNDIATLSQNYSKAKRILKELQDGTITSVSEFEPAGAWGFFCLLSMGAESSVVRSVVLRRRRTIPATQVARSSVRAVERVYTTEALIREFAIPGAVGAVLPTAGDSTPPYSAWGWLERSDSSVIIPAYGKAEEVRDWVFAAWSTQLYDLVS